MGHYVQTGRCVKPGPAETELDRNHWFTQHLTAFILANEGAGEPYNLVDRVKTGPGPAGYPAWELGDDGYELSPGTAHNGLSVGEFSDHQIGTQDFTILTRFKYINGGGAYGAIAGKGDTGVGEWMLNASTNQVRFYGAAGQVQISVSSPNLVSGSYYDLAVSRISGVLRIYLDQRLRGTDLTATNSLSESATYLSINTADWNGATSDSNRESDSNVVYFALAIGRGVTAGQIRELQGNPYHLLLGGEEYMPSASSSGGSSYSHVAAGGSQSGGAADVAFVKAAATSGGLLSGGSADHANTLAVTGIGGALSGGAADVSFAGVNSYSHIAAGGVQSGGEAGVSATLNYLAVGGMQAAGAADVAVSKSVVGLGGVLSGGSADHANTLAVTGIGGAISGGAADLSFTGVNSYSHIASGGLLAAGAAQVSMTTVVQSSGGGQSSGAADVSITKAITGSGGALSGGAANINYTVHIVGAGGGVSGGAADVTTNAITNYSHIAMGGLQSGGAALFDFATTTFPVIAKISFTLKGRTTVYTLKSRKTKLTLH